MRDKRKEVLHLEGRGVVMEEIQPKYFEPVIRWRNDTALNHFLNQPERLTMEKEEAWYERYLEDSTQGFLIMVDKKDGTPFGTLGWTDMDPERRQCISGRLLLGNSTYRNSGQLLESFFLHSDYLYQFVDRMYAHIGVKNRKALHINRLLGFHPNEAEIQYPAELFVKGDHARPQIEYVRTVQEYERKKEKFAGILDVLYEE
ncbi:GNAT family N-acetyltransferase [uncultured Selenomonas sp.]|uniref:GNAT family N-acetyltransferase n=2 Tax=uncultured Selenomonas sp. TaxID=159275 RepID=UPI0025CF118B|nr:GNAT family N-acetyltransferase [uncultured Selenomonas sp.]